MPFSESNQDTILPDLKVVEEQRGGVIPEVKPEDPEVSFFEAFGRAFARDTSIGSIATNRVRAGLDADPEFDVSEAFKALPDTIKGTYGFTPFMRATNGDHFKSILEQIEMEEDNNKFFATAGWKGVAANMAAQLFDPINLIPVGGVAVKGTKTARSVLESGMRFAVAGAAGQTLQESILHSQQETRTLGESAANVSIGALMTGVLGGAGYALFSKRADFPEFKAQLERELTIPEDIQPRSAGAMAVTKKSREELLKDNTIARSAYIKPVSFQDPGLRTMTSPSVNTRLASQNIAEFSPKLKKHLKGEGAVVSVERETLGDADVYGALTGFKNKTYGEYALRVKKQKDTLSLADFNEKVTDALYKGGKSDIPEVNKAAEQYRRLYNKYADEALEVGIFKDKEGITAQKATYVPQVLDKTKAARDPEGLRQRMAEFFKSEYAKAKKGDKARIYQDALETKDDSFFTDLAENSYRNMMGAQSSILQDTVIASSMPKFVKKKVFPREVLQGYLVEDIDYLTHNYTRSMSSRIRMAQRFGLDFLDDDMAAKKSSVVQDIVDEYKELQRKAIKDPKKHKKLMAQEEKDLNDLFAMRDRVLGTYGYTMNSDSWAYRVQKQIKQLNVSTMLGDVTASSVPDVGKVIMEGGLTKFLTKGMRPLLKSLYSKSFKKYLVENMPEVNRLSSGLETTLNGTFNSIADIMDDFGRHTKFERAADVITQKAITLTGIRHWNAAMKQTAGMVINDNMYEALTKIAVGKASTKQISNLARSGISLEDAKLIAKQFKTHGEKVSGLMMPNLAKWDNPRLSSMYMSALRKDMDRVIVTPGAGTTPLWLSKNGLTLFGQFQSFAFSSMQKTLIPIIQDFDAKTAQGIIFMAGLGSLTAAYKRAARGEEMPDTATLIQEGIDRSGIMSWIMDYNNRLERMTQGDVGISRILGTNATNKYYNYGQFAGLGPTTGTVTNMLSIGADIASELAGGKTGIDQDTVRRTRRLIPLQNMIGIRQTLDLMEDEFNNSLGIPKN